MTFSRVAESLPGVLGTAGDLGCEVTELTHDSRCVGPGAVFCCIPGARVDGHAFIPAAAAAGACAFVVQGSANLALVPKGAAGVAVESVRAAMPYAACEVYRHPSRGMRLIGITGTNGKTSTCYLVDSILRAAGETTGLLSTLEVSVPGREPVIASRTTPEASDFQRYLRRMADGGASYVTMEVSSHALALGRVDGAVFDVVAFTNLTHDHLDFHGTPEAYFEAKRLLFTERFALPDGHGAVVNVDDPQGRVLATEYDGDLVTVGRADDATVRIDGYTLDALGTLVRLDTRWGALDLRAQLRGLYSVSNIALGVGVGLAAGVGLDAVAEGVESLQCVPGRLEPVPRGDGQPLVLVDYAHTPDGLENVLRSVREMTTGRVIVVFGCGGDRDRKKRPEMGAAAARLADVCIITSDNPRSEDPDAIIDDIVPGLDQTPYERIVDRREAILKALAVAGPDDVVLLAGKGHETYQEFADHTIDFDDRVVAREALGSEALS